MEGVVIAKYFSLIKHSFWKIILGSFPSISLLVHRGGRVKSCCFVHDWAKNAGLEGKIEFLDKVRVCYVIFWYSETIVVSRRLFSRSKLIHYVFELRNMRHHALTDSYSFTSNF